MHMPTPNICVTPKFSPFPSLIHFIHLLFSVVYFMICGLELELEQVSTNKKTTPNTCMLSGLQKPYTAGLVLHWGCGM